VPPKRCHHALGLRHQQVVCVADIVERVEFHHQVMHAVHRRLHERDGVVTPIGMQGIGVRGRTHVIADASRSR
jgi:hypothetical protein